MTRVEHYLSRLLNNPNQWVRITKLKGQENKRINAEEQRQVLQQIETSLNLMGIPFEKATTFKLRVVDKPKGFVIDSVIAGVDYNEITMDCTYGITFKKFQWNGSCPELTIVDDVYER